MSGPELFNKPIYLLCWALYDPTSGKMSSLIWEKNHTVLTFCPMCPFFYIDVDQPKRQKAKILNKFCPRKPRLMLYNASGSKKNKYIGKEDFICRQLSTQQKS